MRIVHVVRYFQPQMGYEEYYLPKNQLSLGHDVFVITSDRYYPFPNYEQVYKTWLGDRKSPGTGFRYEIGIPTIRLPIWLEIGTTVVFKGLRQILHVLKPEIIHIHGFFFPMTLQVLKYRPSSAKIVLDAHMIPSIPLTQRFAPYVKRGYLKIFYKILFPLFVKKRSKALYVTKEKVAAYIGQVLKISPPIIPLGVDTSLFNQSKDQRRRMRQNMGFQDEDFILFYSGKIIKNKGLSVLLTIYNKLRKEGGRFGLLIVGEGSKRYLGLLLSKVDSPYQKKIKVLPFVEHSSLPRFMSVGDLGCWFGDIPSASINEFLGMGKPVIVKVFEGENLDRLGFSFAHQYKSIKMSVKWIRTLATNEQLYRSLCQNARIFALKNLEWKIITKKILNLYQLDH